MAGETAKVFTNFPAALAEAKHNWKTNDIRVILTTNSFVPDQDAHTLISQITNELPAGGGYTSGGIALTGRDIVVDAVTNKTQLKANNISLVGSTLVGVRRAIVVNYTSGLLCGWVDYGADINTTNSEFQINWNNGVCINLTAA